MSVLAPDTNAGLVALVTGGGTGIGRATALELAHTGAHVAICGRRPEPLEETRAALEAAGAEALAVPADIREPDEAEGLVERTLERFGAVDVLVNNAGGQFIAPAEEISANGWRAVHRLAVDAGWNLTRLVAERSMLPNRRGLVVFIGFSPRRGIPGMAHASAAGSSSRWPRTFGSRTSRPSSGSRRWRSASFRAREARTALHGSWARRVRRSSCSFDRASARAKRSTSAS